jgi:hypothetical protein
VRYQIRVKGVLDSGWSTWFDGLQVTSDAGGQTTIAGLVTDQAALHACSPRPTTWARSCSRRAAPRRTHTDMEASDAEGLNSQAQS